MTLGSKFPRSKISAFPAGAGGPQGGAFAPNVAASTYENFGRLLVFKLDGGPTPLPPVVVRPPMQPTPARIAASPATLAQGEKLYKTHCQRCHMVGGAFGIYPDLWNMSPAAIASFDKVVLEGLFRYAGMGDFSDVLTPADAAAIKAFIVDDTVAKREGAKGATSRTAYH